MSVTFPTTRLGILLGAALAIGIPLFSFTAGYLIGNQTASEATMRAELPAAAVDAAASGDTAAAAAQDTQPDTEKSVETAMLPPDIEEVDPVEPTEVVREVAVKSGDNLMRILVDAGIERTEAHAAITSLEGVYNPRRDLNVGDLLQLTFDIAEANRPGIGGPDGTASNYAFAKLVLPVAYDRDVAVTRSTDGSFSASEITRPLKKIPMRAEGLIGASLFVDGRNAGIPIGVLVDLIRIYSFDVDFQREIQPGDRFEVMYDRYDDEAGKAVHNGEITFARLILSGTELPLYRYETSKGNLDYFNAKGESVRKALMRTPIDGARLSSRFGMRKHPILGYSRLHSGTDFAAPSGTPIYAAGNGTIAEIGTKGGYGKYIRIRHNGTYHTAYAHMRAYARGMTRGKRVQQGQVIGYVGTTGRSTGPHLHYEVHRDGKKINPQTLKLPSGEKLKGDELKLFVAQRDEIDRRYAALAPATQIADTAVEVTACGGDGDAQGADSSAMSKAIAAGTTDGGKC